MFLFEKLSLLGAVMAQTAYAVSRDTSYTVSPRPMPSMSFLPLVARGSYLFLFKKLSLSGAVMVSYDMIPQHLHMGV